MENSSPVGGFNLTPLDQIAPKLYLDWFLSFRRDDPLLALPTLQNGVATLFEKLPFLKARVKHHDQSLSSGKVPTLDSILNEQENGGRGSFQSLLANMPLLSKNIALLFQANIMADGIVLQMRWNHCFMDATGAAAVVAALGECCRAFDLEEGQQQPSIVPLLRKDSSLRETLLNLAYPDSERRPQRHPIEMDDASTEACGFLCDLPTKLRACKFSFSNSRIQRLKELCREFQPSRALSSNDVLTALLAISIHRTREISATPAELVMAVNLRGRFRPPQFESYLGNLVTIVKAPIPGEGPSTASHCRENGIGHDEIQQIVHIGSHIRGRLESLDESYLSSWIQSDPRDLEGITADHIIFSSFRHLKVYQVDFGSILGHIEAFESLNPPANNTCVLLPQAVESSLWQVNITMDLIHLKTLQEDSLFAWATAI
ncbi:unnamed protein product [Penicillium bialowiezense]